VTTIAPASVNVRVKAGPMYWDTPVINVILSSSRTAILPSSYWRLFSVPGLPPGSVTVGCGAARVL
jgi:hypothetical protein